MVKSILPHQANTVLEVFCLLQKTIDRILDLNRIWILQLTVSRIWIGFLNEIVRLDLNLKIVNPFISRKCQLDNAMCFQFAFDEQNSILVIFY